MLPDAGSDAEPPCARAFQRAEERFQAVKVVKRQRAGDVSLRSALLIEEMTITAREATMVPVQPRPSSDCRKMAHSCLVHLNTSLLERSAKGEDDVQSSHGA